jgi:hypothetical protein
MDKKLISLWLDSETFELIEKAARLSGSNRSCVARKLLQMIPHVPPEIFKEKSPLPDFFGITPGGKNEHRPKQ